MFSWEEAMNQVNLETDLGAVALAMQKNCMLKSTKSLEKESDATNAW